MSEISRERREAMDVPLSTVLYMCQAHDREQAAQMGEPSPWDWDDEPPEQAWVDEREAAMREALVVLFRSRNRPFDERDEAVSLLKASRCPDLSCDNEGTRAETAYDERGDPYPEPAPCQWCDERDALLRRVGDKR